MCLVVVLTAPCVAGGEVSVYGTGDRCDAAPGWPGGGGVGRSRCTAAISRPIRQARYTVRQPNGKQQP